MKRSKEGFLSSSKGFYSFFIVLAMMVLLLGINSKLCDNSLELEKSRNTLIDMEQANKERTVMENNTDRIISTKLDEQVAKKNFNPSLMQNEINSALLNYLRERSYASTTLYESRGQLTLDFLNQNSSAYAIQSSEAIYAHYYFTSNPLKTTTVAASFGESSSIYFMMPPGYARSIVVLK
jgi:hypothetical protein